MKYWPVSLLMLATVLIPVPDWSSSADSSSCIICHTDDAKLKSLVKPPKLGSEGEG